MGENLSINRRTLVKGAAWTAPAIAATAAVPAYAASLSTNQDICRYGKLVAAPWSNVWESRKFNGKVEEDVEWAVYPTSNCTANAQYMSIDNNFSAVQAANPLANSNARQNSWPPFFPTNGNRMADVNSVDGVNGTGQGNIIHVTIENVAGDVNYVETPTGNARFLFEAKDGDPAYGPNGYRGRGANVPMIRLNDDFKGANTTYSKLYNYLRFADGPMPAKNTMWTWAYGNHYKTAEGRDGWSWDIEVMSNIAHGDAGASVVSFMTRLHAATFGDASRTNARVIPTQYRVNVTSPWGTVSYLTAAV